jgi:plasmid stabilization system protein ParE
MTSRYTLRQLAQNDLEEIWLYSLQEWGVVQADKYSVHWHPGLHGLLKTPRSESVATTLSTAIIVSLKEATSFSIP